MKAKASIRYATPSAPAVPDAPSAPASPGALAQSPAGSGFAAPEAGWPSFMPSGPGFFPGQAPAAPSSSGSIDILSIINRLGGIEGIMKTVGQVREFIQTIRSAAPLLALLFRKKKPATPVRRRSVARRPGKRRPAARSRSRFPRTPR